VKGADRRRNPSGREPFWALQEEHDALLLAQSGQLGGLTFRARYQRLNATATCSFTDRTRVLPMSGAAQNLDEDYDDTTDECNQ